MSAVPEQPSFKDIGLIDSVESVLKEIGFDEPTPIQIAAMPGMLAGRDILGQAQTGTGKTAAFAMPILSMIDPRARKTQALVLVPTRELAIQLADAFTQYSARMKQVNVVPIYGGSDYTRQFKGLKSGAHIVVGTPGRVMDHMRRGTLNLKNLQFMVLDEADEMLHMGFIDDITWVLEQTPPERQTALFSATLPPAIRNIAQKYMRDPEEIIVKSRTAPPRTINQRYIVTTHFNKIEALCRIIEAETIDGMLVFVRTKVATMEVVEKLGERGYEAEALNGDLKQLQRERTVQRFKSGKVDVLVATDVAARGLDVDRISHVINYDIPQDTETYIHRVGRTGRAGRKGDTILFITNREKRFLSEIERATKQKIALMKEPSAKAINKKRMTKFKEDISAEIEKGDLDFYIRLLSEYLDENESSAIEVSAALAKLLQGDKKFLLDEDKEPKRKTTPKKPAAKKAATVNPAAADKAPFPKKKSKKGEGQKTEPQSETPDESGFDVESYRLEVGYAHGVKERNIVGAIANEAGLDSKYINKLKMHDEYSTVELPSGMPPEIFKILKKAQVGKRPLNLSLLSGPAGLAQEKKKVKKEKPKKAEKPAAKKSKKKTKKKAKKKGK